MQIIQLFRHKSGLPVVQLIFKMNDKVFVNMSNSPTSAPLAPLPPPIKKSISTAKGVFSIPESQESLQIKGVNEQCRKIVAGSMLGSGLEKTDQNWLLCNVDVEPKLQGDAPRCGLVALSMAAEMAFLSNNSRPLVFTNTHEYDNQGSELSALLNLAKKSSFTSQGEIFSAANLALLAKEFYGVNARVTASGFDRLDEIMEHLSKGCPILVPYDAGPNHEPCLSNGHKSHWAVLTGFLCAYSDTEYNWSKLKGTNIKNDDDNHYKSTIYNKLGNTNGFHLPSKMISSELHFIVRQPKSRHVGVWAMGLLAKSNANLFEYNSKKENIRDFVFPEGGVHEGLCRQIIYIS